MSVAELARAYADGRLSRADLVTALAEADYDRPDRVSLVPNHELNTVDFLEDANWRQPGTWDEVRALRNSGAIPNDVYLDACRRADELRAAGGSVVGD